MLDRISPTRCPPAPVRGYQNWRDLLFLHWSVPIAAIRPLVPQQLELDLFEGKAYVGVVPFVMRDVRPSWSPPILALNFLETNVRTYVSLADRPGVYFFSLEAASRLAVWAARTFWGLPYHHATMAIDYQDDTIQYSSHRKADGARHEVEYRIGEPLGPSDPETVEFFLLERYLLFLEWQTKIFVGQVHHSPYPAQHAEVLRLDDTLVEAAGLEKPASLPEFTHYAAGVDVKIFDLSRV